MTTACRTCNVPLGLGSIYGTGPDWCDAHKDGVDNTSKEYAPTQEFGPVPPHQAACDHPATMEVPDGNGGRAVVCVLCGAGAVVRLEPWGESPVATALRAAAPPEPVGDTEPTEDHAGCMCQTVPGLTYAMVHGAPADAHPERRGTRRTHDGT